MVYHAMLPSLNRPEANLNCLMVPWGFLVAGFHIVEAVGERTNIVGYF